MEGYDYDIRRNPDGTPEQVEDLSWVRLPLMGRRIGQPLNKMGDLTAWL